MDDHPTAYTYDQAAAALGIHPEAVRARLRRNALRRGPPANDGRPTVLLSPADIVTIRASARAQPAEAGPGAAPDAAGRPDERDRTIKALEGEAATLRDTLTRERERAGRAVARAEAMERRLEDERQRAAAETAKLREDREAARLAAASAEGESKGLQVTVAELREALAEARRPFWRRWIG